MNAASMVLSALLVAFASLASAVKVHTHSTIKWNGPAVALRGSLDAIPVALARLDPGWWKATTPTTSAAPSAVFKSGSADDTGLAGPPKPVDIFAVEIEECTPFLDMPGTFLANSEYWKDECKAIPANTTYLKMTVGEVTDYFKPKANKKMCEMLVSSDQHLWSGDSKQWIIADSDNTSTGLGGSIGAWLLNHSQSITDKRDTPSFWGVTDAGQETGGCCSSDYTAAAKAWAKPFKMEYCGVPKALAPICTPMTTVAGSFSADKDFWATTCKTIPMTASFVKLAMGSSIDFFRPPTGKSFCDMLVGNDQHKWSKDGYEWLDPEYDTNVTTSMKGFGGSADKGVVTGDARTKVSFWGSSEPTQTGGCCYAALDDEEPAFGKSFTMSYCEIPTAPPVAQLMELLHSNEAGVQALENEIGALHTRLFSAEDLSIEAAGNVSLARSGVYKLAAKTSNEADTLNGLILRSSMTNSSLDMMSTGLANSEKVVRAASNTAKATKAVAEKIASPQGLQTQDTLNDKIWKLMDPTNKESLAATEQQVSDMEQATDKFRGLLGTEVKSVMVAKMRRTVHRLREAVQRLGTAGNKASDDALGETDSAEPLGSDLGLDDG